MKVKTLSFVIAHLTIIFILLLSACSKPGHQLVQQQLFTFGTLVDISIWTDKADEAKLLIQQLSADFEQQHRQWHPTNKGSLLVALNKQLQQHKAATLDPSLIDLINLAIKFSTQSENLFNPAIGQLIDLWHFDQDLTQHDPLETELEIGSETGQPPNMQQLKSLVALKPLMSDLIVNQQQIKSVNPSVKLDLGAFAKGYAVDLAIKRIKKAGFNHALVNAGGDIKALGSKGNKAWNIGIRNPFYQQQPNHPVIAAIKLNDNESIMTSGDYERYFNYQGKRYHHIIDPRSGYPANGFHSVTVVHRDAALADAAATALFIAGPQHWKKIAKQMGVDKAMLISQQNEIFVTQKLQARLSFQNQSDDNKQIIIVVELD